MENQKDKSEVVSSLMKRVRQNVTDCFAYAEAPEEQEENFRQLFLEHPNGAHRLEELTGEDNYEDRYDKFYVLADALRAELVTRRGLDARQIRLFIDVMDNDFEDRVYITYLYTPKEDAERGVLLHTSSVKVGQRFETLAHFEAYLWQEYTRLDSGYDFATDLLGRAVRPSV